MLKPTCAAAAISLSYWSGLAGFCAPGDDELQVCARIPQRSQAPYLTRLFPRARRQ